MTNASKLDRIKSINILSVIQDCGYTLHKSGSNKYKSICPWHADQSIGSFIIYTRNNSCACFACGHGGSVIDYYMAAKNVDFATAVKELEELYIDSSTGASRVETKKYIEPETLHIKLDAVRKTISGYSHNTLLKYLSTIFDKNEVERIAREYLVGTTKDGSTLFWYKSFGENSCRSAKIIKYKPDGHRDKSSGGTWIHALFSPYEKTDINGNVIYSRPPRLDITQWSDDPSFTPEGRDTEWKARFTLFGEHLLHDPARKDLPVCIVESEKSAIICALYEPRFLWLATGGKNFLKEDRMAALQYQGRQVILVPDRDALVTQVTTDKNGREHISPSWEETAMTFMYRDHIAVCRDVEELAKDLQVDDPKCDIADLYLLLKQNTTDQNA